MAQSHPGIQLVEERATAPREHEVDALALLGERARQVDDDALGPADLQRRNEHRQVEPLLVRSSGAHTPRTFR